MTLSIPCGGCPAQLSADSAETLLPVVLAHMAEAHSHFPVTTEMAEDFITASLRQEPILPRVETTPDFTIVPLTPDRAADYFDFFDHRAFCDNPFWASCYCVAFQFGGTMTEWEQRRDRENRALAAQFIADGTHQGFLAYVDNRVVGWCSANRRTMYRPLAVGGTILPADDPAIGTIICFMIAPPYRRHGLATQLLSAAIARFREWGCREVEAFPAKASPNAAHAFHGPRELYDAAGFTVATEYERQWRMTKPL